MMVLEWIRLFAAFAEVAPDVVDAFAEEHPELGEPPKPDEQRNIRDNFLDGVADKFHDSQPPPSR
jgi:hypothetical protein